MSKNNVKMVQRKMADQKQKFGIRKLSVGVASVLLGTVFYMQGGTVHADVNSTMSVGNDTANVVNENSGISSSAVTLSTSNSASSANSASSVFSASDVTNSIATSQAPGSSMESATSQVSNSVSAVSEQGSVVSTSQVNAGVDNVIGSDNTSVASSLASVQNSQVSASTENTSNEQARSNSLLSLTQGSNVNTSFLAVSKVASTDTSNNVVNGGFDQSTWGKLDVNAWQGSVQGDYYELTDYTGDANHVIVPNEADFAKAGISTAGKQVGVTSDLMHNIFRYETTAQDATVAFSKTDNKQVKAIDINWHDTWNSQDSNWGAKLSRFDGTNLDVFNVTDMNGMFFGNKISDLSSLSNWKVDNVTDMSGMFYQNQISDLNPLSNWKVNNVIDMSVMLSNNKISDLSPLANWNTNNVTNMHVMFSFNQISDLSPLANWKIGKVTYIDGMFLSNQISDLSPLSNWHVDNVTDMTEMFEQNQISDLSPLAKWNVNNVIGMSNMFASNHISNLSPLANWKVDQVIYMGGMFAANRISNLSPLASWKVDKVMGMEGMFEQNQISDISSLANWKVDNVEDMSSMFDNNSLIITQAKRVINFVYPAGYTGKKQGPVTQTVDLPQKVSVTLTTKDSKPSNNILDWVTKTETPETPDPVYFQDYTVPEIKGLLEPDQTVIAGQQADITKPINVTVTYKLVDSNTNDAFALDIKNGLHEHANVNDNGGYDADFWGTLDVSKFTTVKNGDNLEITGYTGDASKVIIPNIADFEIDNLDQGAKRVTISSNVMHKLAKNATRIGLSKTNNQKAVANDSDWSDAFGGQTDEPNTNSNADGGMWVYNPNLRIMDLHNLDTTNITDMDAMFNGGRNLNVVGDLAQWNVANVASMHAMFQNALSLTNIGNLDDWDTSKVTDMNSMFGKATSLTNIGDLSKWDTGNVTNMHNMFANATNLTNIGNLDNWNTSKVTDMSWMFGTDTGKQSHLTNIGDLSKWDTGNVTDMSCMFFNATNLTNIGNLDNWSTSKVTNMIGMFGIDSGKPMHLTNIGNLSKWQTGNVTNMSYMFSNATNLTNIGNLDNWNTSKVTDMSYMFYNATHLTNIGNLSKWQTGNVTNMSHMFMIAKVLRHLNISNWDLTKLVNKDSMQYIFAEDPNLTVIANNLALPTWYQNEINDAGYFWNNHMAVITNVPELIRATGDIDSLKIDDQNASRSIFYDSKGSSDAIQVLKDANQAYIKQYQNEHPGYILNLAADVDQTDPLALANAKFISSADSQKLMVNFIDDVTGKTLETVNKVGQSDESANYNTKSDISKYIAQHYDLVSDDTKGSNLVFDHDDNVDQVYNVHLTHHTHQINDQVTKSEVIHYVYADGLARTGQAADDYHAKDLVFTRDGYYDEVTNEDHWNAWTPSATQQFDAVRSPLVAGYTPDLAQIDSQTVKPTDTDLEFTVTYTPNVQIAHVKYIDDTDHKVLTQDDLNGRTGETSGYHTADRITEFKGQHYVLVSDNYPTEGMIFDNHDRIDQTYEVHFKHATRTDEQDVQVPRTIKYVYQNGRLAQPDHTDALSFHETKVVDLVDGHTVSNDWTPAQDFKTIETPAIQGYTPDHASVSNAGIAYDHPAIVETVTYNSDAQKAVVKYIDDTTGEQLEVKDLSGVSDQSTGYNTKETIDGYVNKHYVLVSDGTHGETVVFDHDDDADQAYEVHFKHGTEPANESRIKKIIVHYQYADGLARSGKAADNKTVTNLTFKRTGTHDLVTDKIVWNAWDHADQTFASVDSQAIQGYTPDRTVVDNINVNPDSRDLTEVTVTYNADSQKLSVDFIDDTTGKTLKTINKIGYSDESADYNTKADVQDLISKHYDLVSDTTNGANLVFDHDDNINQHYEVHLSHHTHQINEQHTVTETIHYQYADGLARSGKAADDFNANALKFSRDGFNDEVTGVDHWNAWTPAAQQSFAAVQSPVIEGYTPDQSEIDAINVVPISQNIEKTVTYTADAQKLTVNFIDDVTGQTLKTVAKTGYSDESVGYNTKADLQGYLAKHYDLVSDATKGAELVFDHNDGVDQVYDVHLTHHLTPISDHQVVNETIHYVYADGLARTGKAADDYAATPLEFNRTGKHDDVTGTDAWDAWTPGNANFAAVQSPLIQGYTPDQSQIDVILVDANSQDIVKTVTYSADQQKMTIDFIDDTDNGKVLKTVIKTGGSDEAVGYNTKSDIQTFVDSHYKLDHDTSNGANLVFDHDDAVDQHYEVHLTHETTPITEATSTNQVIHYQLVDGTPVANDYTAKVDFSRDGFKDLVTNADHWNAWTPNATQTFDTVKSPAKAGYTPDHAQVDAVTVEPHHANLETTVTYSPDAQKAAVKYIDDVTGKTLQMKELTGVSDETSTYTTGSTIKQYVGQHYKLVSDQTNGKPVVFDHDDGSDQTFEVHLTHTYQSVSQEHQVHQTIHYQYADGKQARPDYSAKALAFSRTGTQDLVTENIQWNAWTLDQVFAAVDTPAINGYTPDVQTVAPVKVSHDSKDIEQTVIYHADDQTILVNYIDDETHSTLKTDSIIGKTAQTSDYTTKKSLDKYKVQHYDVVSDDTNGDTLTFDSDSTKVQTYNVHLKHQHQAASDESTVHQTVHYVYQDGKQAAKDHTATPIEFTRTGDTDLVTGKTTWNPWTPATGTFVAVLSPVITGYTPSRAMIDHVDVHPGDKDLDTTVTYVPDRQVIVVNYIDQTTGKTLKTDTLNGHSDQTSGYTTKSQIDSYIGQHYQLISDDTNGQALIFDHDDQATQTYDVVLGHQTEAAHRTHEVRETIDYVYADGSQAAKSFTAQPIVFTQNGVHDLVTNTTDWNGEWTKSQVFSAVESPKITGFTSSKPEVKAVEVTHQSSDVHELVIYAANAQTAQIKYIDDVTGNVLETDGANGHFGESIVFSYNVNDQINKFKQAHYKFVSNNFAGQKYQSDDTKNVYEVHLIHERQNVHVTDAITETVKFQYADGSQAQPTKTQTVNFSRDGIKDLVTGTTAWMPVDSQTIGAVDVPAINGYTADIDQVPGVKVNFGDVDITKVVTYTANDQLVGIKYIDDTTGKTLDTEAASGKFGTKIEFMRDPSAMIQKFEGQGYKFKSNSFNGQKYQADNSQNEFEVHFTHGTQNVSRTNKVTETVKYQFVDGRQAQKDHVQIAEFTQHGVQDLVTKTTDWAPSDSQIFVSVDTPHITGYTADVQNVPAATVKFGDEDITKVVTYKANDQLAGIKYIDDTIGKTLDTEAASGKFGTKIEFMRDPSSMIQKFEGQGYKLVSDNFKSQDYQADNSKNQFEVHFKHGMKTVSRTSTITRTIKYVDQTTGKEVHQPVIQTLTITENGVTDLVTGKTTWDTPSDQQFVKVESPKIDGYENPDILVVDAETAKFGDGDQTVTVHYQKVETPATSDTSKALSNSSTPSAPTIQAKSNISTMPMHTPTQVGSQNVSGQQISNNRGESQLPQTGNQDSHQAGLVGLVSVIFAGLLGLGKRRKKND